MARVPRIDSPCPLSRAEQLRIDGHCGRCNKHVHALDGLDERQRRALFAAARGPLCVSYRVPVYRSPAMAVAMAAMISAGTAMAGQDCDDVVAPLQSMDAAQASPLLGTDATAQAEASKERLDTLFMGGVNLPEDADWVDDSNLPDLPIVVEDEREAATGATLLFSARQASR